MNFGGDDIKMIPVIKNAIKQIAEKILKGDFNVAAISKPIPLTCKMSMLEGIAKYKIKTKFLKRLPILFNLFNLSRPY